MTTTSIVLGDNPPSALYALIAQQPFFEGLIPPHLQLLTESAMEMQFEPGQFLLQEGSPAIVSTSSSKARWSSRHFA